MSAPSKNATAGGASGVVSGAGDWTEEAIAGASLRRVDLDNGVNGWAAPPGDLFNVRQRGYLSGKKLKGPAGEWLLRPAGVDWLRSTARLDHVLARDDNGVAAAFRKARKTTAAGGGAAAPAFLIAVNIQVPARPETYSAVFYFAADEPIPPDSLLGRFVSGDDAFRSSRIKMINRIAAGPWIVRAAVGSNAACLVGRQLAIRYHRGDGYLEIDIDMGSSAVAAAVLGLALGYSAAVTVDMGFAVEPQEEEELPEKIFGAVRISKIQMSAARVVAAGAAVDAAGGASARGSSVRVADVSGLAAEAGVEDDEVEKVSISDDGGGGGVAVGAGERSAKTKMGIWGFVGFCVACLKICA